ncbi:MAG TPA: S8 family serine peptidase, partial [Anaerolineaceae bacterium]|nr:S8 family serine peptidase [Anaerolineaceae bacterium]
MKKFLIRLFTLLIVMGLVVTPALAQTPPPENTDRISPTFETPTRQEPKPVPQEIIDLFKDGMSIEDFLASNKGPIPTALMAYANLPVTVIVQLESPSLVSYMEKQEGTTGTGIGITSQQSYVAELTSDQDALLNQVSSAGIDAVVISRYTKALNGFMARVAFKDLQALRSLPGVKSIARAPEHTIDSTSQGAPMDAGIMQAVNAFKPKGTGVRIAIIDTGIDYTHKLLGGDGDPESYLENDPSIIEDETFPTLKVIGGYDFAGTNYNAANNDDPAIYNPVPDPDPLDENGHGTHVSSIAAGMATTGLGNYLVPGVAPDASLYALKVFGATGSTNLVVDAIEWAMDPNQDGSVDDHVDVINMSLGSSFGPAIPDDPEFLAVEAANAAGIFVVASSGNAGDEHYVTGSPANTDSALSVASSTTEFMYAPFIAYNDGLDQQIPYNTSDNAFVSAISGQLVDVTTRGDTTGLLCSTTGVSAMTDEIALIQRGSCSFYIKINNAEALGAKAAIIYNNAAGSINMATAGSSLPAGSILQSDGLILKGLSPIDVVIGPDSNVGQFLLSTPAGTLSDFSSRGPRGYDSMLKPEITAPGSDIFAAQMGSGNLGISMSGTSMAAPYVAGAAALMKEVHSDWTNEQIKAALMNTADDLADPVSSMVPKQGAGEIDVPAALRTQVVAVGDPKFVSLNWGLLELTDATFSSEKSVTLHNSDPIASLTFDVGALFTSPVS